MSLRFSLKMARRESRSTRRRLFLYTGAVTLGVAALVAINSFRANVTRAVNDQARDLLGADLRLGSRWEFPPDVEALLAGVRAEGSAVSRVTMFPSMALATGSGLTRLVQVHAPSGDYPYYGTIETKPEGLWGSFRAGRNALVDPAVLVQLEASLGDSLAIGNARFRIVGTVATVPGEIGLRSAIGPRVYIPGRYLSETGLLRTGSVALYRAYLKFDEPAAAHRLVEENDSLLEANRVWSTTAEEYEEDLGAGLDRLGGFLGLVGLVALLLGGVGVASGVHVFVSDKLDTVAVLRCLGARQLQAFTIYLVQAATMGLAAASAGVALGIAVQAVIPVVVADFLPLDIPFRPAWGAILTGLGIGVWVSLIFALLPLLRIKDVSPLRALRRDYETTQRRLEPWRLSTYAVLAISLLGLAVWQAPEVEVGLAFAVAIAVAMAGLGVTAFLLMRLTRRYFPRRASFALRQGVANLFRPHNQTLAITLAVGFGVFLIATLYVVQRNLLDQILRDTRPDRPNLLIFDVQRDQRSGVAEVLKRSGAPFLQPTPIVPARIDQLGDRRIEEVLADTVGPQVPRWALLREYRHTYRDSLVGSEQVVAGTWFLEDGETTASDTLSVTARVSLEESIAEELNVWVGDRITWDIQGVLVETVVSNVRRVDWARFEPNFFAVFEPGVLDDAPQTLIVLTRADDATRRAEIQRDLVLVYPNISAIDLTTLLDAIDSILGKVALAIRFMALFSVGSGIVILIGAISTSRYQRTRESVLLKTLGARSRTIRRALGIEYFALGFFAGLTGVIAAAIAAWVAVRFQFELDFQLPGLPLLAFWLAAALLTTGIGLANSRDVVRRTPLAGLRDFAD